MTKNNLLVYVCATRGQVQEWIQILPLGKVELVDSRAPFEVTRPDLNRIISKFTADGLDLVVDYEHQSLGDGKAPAAGWIKELQVRIAGGAPALQDGLYARVEWTAEGQRLIEAGEYKYYSPVITLNPETRRPLALMHAALTNTPAITKLAPLLAAKYGEGGEEEILVLGSQARTPAPQQQEEATAMLKKLIAKLGLPPETTEDQVLALVAERVQEAVALKVQVAVLPQIAQVLALKADASVSEIIGTIKGLKGNQDRLATVETELLALKQAQSLREAEAAVDAAIMAKKITPAMREIKLKQAQRDLAEFKAEMTVAPVILATDPLKPPKGGGGKDGLDAEQLSLCATTGIKPEAFKASREQLIEQGLLREEG